MVKAKLPLLKKLRNETSFSIADLRKALEETNNDYKKALEWIKKHGIEKAEKKADRKTAQGIIESYIHQNGKVGTMVELLCETDFVARTNEFKNLAHEIAMQVAAMAPKMLTLFLSRIYQGFIFNHQNLIKQTIAKLGENILVKRFTRYELDSNG